MQLLLSLGFPFALIGGRAASTSVSVHFTPNFPSRELKKQGKGFPRILKIATTKTFEIGKHGDFKSSGETEEF